MKILTLILACVALAGCHAKKLSYRDLFYFGGKDTHGIQIATTDTIKRTGDWKTDVYSTGTIVLNTPTKSLYFRLSSYKTMCSVTITPDSIIHLNMNRVTKLNDSTYKIKQ